MLGMKTNTNLTLKKKLKLLSIIYNKITKLDKEKINALGKKTGAENIVKEIKQYQEKWLQQVQRMDTKKIPKQALQYKPK
jgi:hypothetical protein